jgi:hypothetical protein
VERGRINLIDPSYDGIILASEAAVATVTDIEDRQN